MTEPEREYKPLRLFHVTSKIDPRKWKCSCGHVEDSQEAIDQHWRAKHGLDFQKHGR